MKKLTMSLATALMVALPLLADTEKVGDYTWTYNIEGGFAVISADGGTFTTPSVSPSPQGALTVPSFLGGCLVASVGDFAFRGCTGLTAVTIPSSVTNIGHCAFEGCSGLTSVAIPSSVTSIGNSAFMQCSGLTNVVIQNGVTCIGEYAFYCSGLTSVTIPNGVTRVGASAFGRCTGLTDVTIPASLTTIEGSSFFQTGLERVTIPNGIVNIEHSAFGCCTNLTVVSIPASVTNIAYSAFQECYKLMEYIVADDNSSYKSVSGLLLTKNGEILVLGLNGDVTVPDGVESICDFAFYFCVGLTNVTLPDSLRNIGEGSFVGCSGLTNVTIPNGVTNIGDWAFSSCRGLTNVAISDRVTNIGENAFYNCSSLTQVTIPQYVCTRGMLSVFPAAYQQITNVVISDGATCIGKSTFSGCNALTSVTIPDSVSDLSITTFDGCDRLWTSWYKTLANASARGGNFGASYSTITHVVTNVVVHYVTQSVPSTAVIPPEATGIVNIVSEVNAGAALAVTSEWAMQYPNFTSKFGSDFTKAITMQTGKFDGSGNPMMVWQDFVAGTDPTNPDDKFTASITFDKDTNEPVISWSPELSPIEAAKRSYKKYGKVRLNDAAWTEIVGSDASDYNFFKVTVEMK